MCNQSSTEFLASDKDASGVKAMVSKEDITEQWKCFISHCYCQGAVLSRNYMNDFFEYYMNEFVKYCVNKC